MRRRRRSAPCNKDDSKAVVAHCQVEFVFMFGLPEAIKHRDTKIKTKASRWTRFTDAVEVLHKIFTQDQSAPRQWSISAELESVTNWDKTTKRAVLF